MAAPVRLQLSRRKGFDLQALSVATNGLTAVNVARPGPFGNPFVIHPNQPAGRRWGVEYISVPTAEDAVECFREMLATPAEPGQRAHGMRAKVCDERISGKSHQRIAAMVCMDVQQVMKYSKHIDKKAVARGT